MANHLTAGARWSELPTHAAWLDAERDRLLRFHELHARESAIGFAALDATGTPVTQAPRELYSNARLVHCFAIEHLLGRPGAADLASHGLEAITGPFRDPEYGGWYAAINPDGSIADDTKSTYAHAFVILAGASATQAGLPGGRELLDESLGVVSDRLWEETSSAAVEACLRDWTVAEPGYRGQNANMHLTEAYMAAFDATDDRTVQRRAELIATKLIHQHARAWDWRVPEHFNGDWEVDLGYNQDRPNDPFRPAGTVPGHWFEWVRLVLTLQSLPGSRVSWAQEAAIAMFDRAVLDGWDDCNGGVLYSTDLAGGAPINTDKMYWTVAEAVGAAVYLAAATDDVQYEHWYRAFWNEIEAHVIDREHGSWKHQQAADGTLKADIWPGKPDLYHAWQATLYSRLDPGLGLAAAARSGKFG